MERLNKFVDGLPNILVVPFAILAGGFAFGCVVALFLAGFYLPMSAVAWLLGW